MSAVLPAAALPADPVLSRQAVWANALRESGLLRLSLPVTLGGDGLPWPEILQTLRDLCERDGGLARLFAIHHLQLTRVRLLGSREQRQRLLAQVALRDSLWGGLGEEGEHGLRALEHVRGGFRISGQQRDVFAAEEADWVVLQAWHPNSAAGLLAVVPAQRTGLERRNGRDGLICQDLRVHPEDVLLPPGWPPTPQTEACQALVRLLQANLALGLAAHAEAGLPASPSRQRLLGLGVRLIEAAAQPLDALLADVPGLDFRHSRVLANLCGQAEAVACRAAQESLQAQSLQARLLAFA